MRKLTKILLTTAILLIIIGAGLFIFVLAKNDWDFKKLSNEEIITNTYDVTDDFNKISIDIHIADINFKESTDGKCKVLCEETKKYKHTVNVADNTLSISSTHNRKWYDFINIFPSSVTVTLYLTKTTYNELYIDNNTGDSVIPTNFKFDDINIEGDTGDVTCYSSVTNNINIDISTGEINLDNITASNLNLKTSTGRITLNNVTCTNDIVLNSSTGKNILKNVKCCNLISDGSTGSIQLTSVIASQKITIDRSTGSVKFELSDANTIKVTTSTGSVKGTLLTNKIFTTKSSTGSVNVPQSTEGGTCEIKTSTGNISISIA